MPEFTIPTTPEQWADVETNETDARLRDAWWDKGFLGTEAFDQEQLAAASRLLERERCVERLAGFLRSERALNHRWKGGLLVIAETQQQHAERCESEARRILEDAK